MEESSTDAVWDFCYTCGIELEKSEQASWRQCIRCERIHLSLTAIGLAAVLGMWTIVAVRAGLKPSSALCLIGLTLTALGAVELARGFFEQMVMSASGYGGGFDQIRPKLKKQSRMIRIGLGLVFLGTVFQGVALAF